MMALILSTQAFCNTGLPAAILKPPQTLLVDPDPTDALHINEVLHKQEGMPNFSIFLILVVIISFNFQEETDFLTKNQIVCVGA